MMGDTIHLSPSRPAYYYRGWTIEPTGGWPRPFRYSEGWDGSRRSGEAATLREAIAAIDELADAVDLPPLGTPPDYPPLTFRDAVAFAALGLITVAAVLLLGGGP